MTTADPAPAGSATPTPAPAPTNGGALEALREVLTRFFDDVGNRYRDLEPSEINNAAYTAAIDLAALDFDALLAADLAARGAK